MTLRLFAAGLLSLALAQTAPAQAPSSEPVPAVQWVEFEGGLKAASATGKHIMVDVYTDWCGYCKKLESETYSEESVRRVLAESFISIKLKGDSGKKLKVTARTVESQGKTLLQFVTTDTASSSEAAISRGALKARGFPTIAFLAPDGRLITTRGGYVNAEQFIPIINYIKDDLYEVMTFDDYLRSLAKAEEKS